MGREQGNQEQRDALQQFAGSLPDFATVFDQAAEQLQPAGQAVNRGDWTEALMHAQNALAVIRGALGQVELDSPAPDKVRRAHTTMINALNLQLEAMEQIEQSAQQKDQEGFDRATQLYDQGLTTVVTSSDRLQDEIASVLT